MAGCMYPLPCQVGDEVWAIHRYNHSGERIKKGVVTEMYFTEGMRLCIIAKNAGRGEWGKNIFPTEEAAEAFLRGRAANG